nr:anoctamin-6-like isoform X2 [Camelus dromedarius]
MCSSSKHRQEAALRSHQEEERVPFTTWGKCIHITLCASAFFWVLLTIASVIGIIVCGLSVFIVFSAKLSKNLNGRDPIQNYLTAGGPRPSLLLSSVLSSS